MGLLYLNRDSTYNTRAELFANNEQGLWLDPSQISTLYQDSNGVTPCTAAGDPVGLILDQSRGGLGNLGPELVTNGDFGAATGWTLESGWSIGVGLLTGLTTSGLAYRSAGIAPNKWYRYEVLVTSATAGAVRVRINTSSTDAFSPNITTAGTHTGFLLAPSTANGNISLSGTGFSGQIDSFSIREVPGNHAYQTTSASRPTLARIPSSGRRNLLSYTQQFDNAYWTASAVTIQANSATAPDGTTTAANIYPSSTGSNRFIWKTPAVSITASTAYTFSVYAKANNIQFLYFGLLTGSTAAAEVPFFDLTNGTVSQAGTYYDSVSITATGGGWYRCSATKNSAPASAFPLFGLSSASGSISVTASGTSGVLLWGAQLETGSTATNYQKVVATTDVTESGVSDLWHLVFDGSDDSLVTNSVDFTATDEMTVIAGVRKLSDASTQMILELSANVGSNSGSFYLTAAELTGASGNFSFKTRGDVNPAAYANSGTILAPATRVISGLGDISSDAASIRINSTQTDYSADQGSGNFGNHILYIGRRGGTTLPYNGHIYQLIIRGKTTPTGKLLEAERFVAKRTGVTGI